MRLELSDPIWSRMYGPYGVRDVPAQLRRLAARWDAGEAEHLFWEELHHQDDLYPVTYAALPWLVDIAPRTEPVQEFLAHVLFCARRQGWEAAPLRGLSLDPADHAHPWLPVERRLRAGDMGVLRALAGWITGGGDALVQEALEAITADRPHFAAHMVGGYAGWHGGRDLPHAVQMWADGESLAVARAEGAPDATDRRLAMDIADAVADRQPGLARFLRDYVAP